MCELFGVSHINCGLMETYSVEHTAQKTERIMRQSGQSCIGVEPMPYSGIPNVKRAWEIVKAVNVKMQKDHSGFLALAQSQTSRSIFVFWKEFRQIRCVSVQINDVYERAYAENVLRDESMHDRLAPEQDVEIRQLFAECLRKRCTAACIRSRSDQ